LSLGAYTEAAFHVHRRTKLLSPWPGSKKTEEEERDEVPPFLLKLTSIDLRFSH
jgi:hypothetical protein